MHMSFIDIGFCPDDTGGRRRVPHWPAVPSQAIPSRTLGVAFTTSVPHADAVLAPDQRGLHEP